MGLAPPTASVVDQPCSSAFAKVEEDIGSTNWSLGEGGKEQSADMFCVHLPFFLLCTPLIPALATEPQTAQVLPSHKSRESRHLTWHLFTNTRLSECCRGSVSGIQAQQSTRDPCPRSYFLLQVMLLTATTNEETQDTEDPDVLSKLS